MRTYHVFNVDQVEGVDHLRVGGAGDTDLTSVPEAAYQRAEDAIAATKADIRFGGDRAFYSLEGDYIQMPPKATFTELDEYYETIFHELVHHTEHPSRLNWNRKGEGYAMGELIAELGACFLARELGVPCSENLTNHAAYLQNWIQAMEGDSRFIFSASSQASKAADYILAFSQQPDIETTPEPEGVLVG
jgi:antirestriction protein ArdC